jgi:hypothetical protein
VRTACCCSVLTSHVTRHTSHVTRHTSHVTRHTSHVTRHPLHVTRDRMHSHVARSSCSSKSHHHQVRFAINVSRDTLTPHRLVFCRLFGAHYDGSSASRCGGAKIISQIVLVGGGSGGVLSSKEQAEAEQWQVENVVVLLAEFQLRFWFFVTQSV